MRAATVFLALLAAPALALSTEAEFAQWKAQWGRVYPTTEEEALRLAIFRVNSEKIAAHNARGLPYSFALNAFGDLTPREFAMGHIGGTAPRGLKREDVHSPVASRDSLPSSVDWSAKGAVTPVKNQGQCGSCWAFASVSTVESINEIHGHGLIELSVQQVVDCSGPEGNDGCNGGLPDQAFEYIIKSGLCTAAAYPYNAQTGTCKTTCKPVVHITGYKDVKPKSDLALATAVVQQTVALAIEADQDLFQFYSSGVLTGPCGTQIDHGMILVGYGEEAGLEYFKLQNMWGKSWGMNGYVLLARNETYNAGYGECGIYSVPSYPIQA